MRVKNCGVTSMVCIFGVYNVILLRKYTGKNEIKQGNHRENTGNFALWDEWEPCECTKILSGLDPQSSKL